ncbi:MAG: methyltransferase domain-containing protein [Bacteroidales bacterium]|nr:methyltransferase domain-containing protein [Bacteroidales bacterium]
MDKAPKVEQYFDKQQDYYLNNNPVIKLRKEIVESIAGNLNNKNIIDIGSGNGNITSSFLNTNKVTYVDISSKLLEIISKNSQLNKHNVSLIKGDILTLNFMEKFDLVVCLGLIAHINDVNRLIEKICSIMDETGIAIIQFTDSSMPISRINHFKSKLRHKRNYNYNTNKNTLPEIKKIISDNKLKIERLIKHWPVSPFFSFFNDKIKLKLLRYSYQNSFISCFGAEVILVLKKAA